MFSKMFAKWDAIDEQILAGNNPYTPSPMEQKLAAKQHALSESLSSYMERQQQAIMAKLTAKAQRIIAEKVMPQIIEALKAEGVNTSTAEVTPEISNMIDGMVKNLTTMLNI